MRKRSFCILFSNKLKKKFNLFKLKKKKTFGLGAGTNSCTKNTTIKNQPTNHLGYKRFIQAVVVKLL